MPPTYSISLGAPSRFSVQAFPAVMTSSASTASSCACRLGGYIQETVPCLPQPTWQTLV